MYGTGSTRRGGSSASTAITGCSKVDPGVVVVEVVVSGSGTVVISVVAGAVGATGVAGTVIGVMTSFELPSPTTATRPSATIATAAAIAPNLTHGER